MFSFRPDASIRETPKKNKGLLPESCKKLGVDSSILDHVFFSCLFCLFGAFFFAGYLLCHDTLKPWISGKTATVLDKPLQVTAVLRMTLRSTNIIFDELKIVSVTMQLFSFFLHVIVSGYSLKKS